MSTISSLIYIGLSFRIFLAFSNFVEMHGLLSGYRVGLLSMKVQSPVCICHIHSVL